MPIQRSTPEALRGIGAGGDWPTSELEIEGRVASKDDGENWLLVSAKVLLRLYTSDRYALLFFKEKPFASSISSISGAVHFDGEASASWMACHRCPRRILHFLLCEAM